MYIMSKVRDVNKVSLDKLGERSGSLKGVSHSSRSPSLEKLTESRKGRGVSSYSLSTLCAAIEDTYLGISVSVK